jgi:hypothetical protein
MLIAVAICKKYTFSIAIEHNIEEDTSFEGNWYAKPKNMSTEAENEWVKMRAGLEEFTTSSTITSWIFDAIDKTPTEGMPQKVTSAIDRRYPGLQDASPPRSQAADARTQQPPSIPVSRLRHVAQTDDDDVTPSPEDRNIRGLLQLAEKEQEAWKAIEIKSVDMKRIKKIIQQQRAASPSDEESHESTEEEGE